MSKRPKWKNELHLLDLTCVPHEQIDRARVLESVCLELDTMVAPTSHTKEMAKRASAELSSLEGIAGRSISAKTMERIWYTWKNNGRNIKALIDKRYFKLNADISKRPLVTLHAEELSRTNGEELITWDDFLFYVTDMGAALCPLGKWNYLLGRSKMYADTQYDKLMRSSVFAFMDKEVIPDMPQEAKAQLYFRLMWAFYRVSGKKKQENNASISMSEAAFFLANLITKEWHKTAYKWLFQQTGLIKIFE